MDKIMEQEKLSKLSSLIISSERKEDFHSIVSNPPYQMSSLNSAQREGRDIEVVNVFQYFYEISTKISKYSTMIFPGGRWMQRSHGNNAISNLIFNSVSEVLWFPNGEEKRIQPVFEHAAISDGVSIVLFKKENTQSSTIFVNNYEINRPKDKEIVPLSAAANSIVNKIENHKTLNDRKIETNIFKLETNWVEHNLDKVVEYTESLKNQLDDQIIAYLGNSTPGKNKRVQKYLLKEDTILWTPRLKSIYESWKIVCSQGQVSKRPATSSYRILEKDTVVGASWLILGTFETFEETVNYKKYIDTSFARFMIEESRGGKSSKWGIFVPDLTDYTSNNSKIDWTKPLDPQLFELFQLSNEEQRTVLSQNFHWMDKNTIS